MNITKITELKPIESTLPNGTYSGKYSGYLIKITHNKKNYELYTEKGIRGINVNVLVKIVNGNCTFEMEK